MIRKRTLQAVVAIGAVAASIAIAGCAGKKITDDQMTQLQERKREIASLENNIKDNDAEKARLNSELQDELAQAQKCNDDINFVKDKLSRWPDCWPDWHPAPPPAADTTQKMEEKHHKHHH